MFIRDLLEASSSKLYHATYVSKAVSILKEKKFNLTLSLGNKTEREFQNNKFYFLQTTRSKLGDYTKATVSEYFGTVVMNLNGDWFNNNYSGKAVDYWSRGLNKAEMEDRIFHTKPTIPLPNDMSKVITELHIFMKRSEAIQSKDFRNLVILCKRNNIPVYYYNDEKAFILQNKSKSKNAVELAKQVEPTDNQFGYSSRRTDWTKVWRELYYKNDFEKLESRTRERARQLYHGGIYVDDIIRSIEADLHNLKSGKDEVNQKGLYKLSQIFRKEKIKSPEEFIELLRVKWERILDDA